MMQYQALILPFGKRQSRNGGTLGGRSVDA
jgi:hypothetical protein